MGVKYELVTAYRRSKKYFAYFSAKYAMWKVAVPV